VAFSDARPKLKIGLCPDRPQSAKNQQVPVLPVSAYAQGWDDAAPRDRRHIITSTTGSASERCKAIIDMICIHRTIPSGWKVGYLRLTTSDRSIDLRHCCLSDGSLSSGCASGRLNSGENLRDATSRRLHRLPSTGCPGLLNNLTSRVAFSETMSGWLRFARWGLLRTR
jgi:hypothetical protein